MIYFQNHHNGFAGLNNHVIPFTLCISLSNFLERDFYFDHELPCTTPPAFAITGKLKDKFQIIMSSPRSKVSDLLKIPNRRRTEVDRDIVNKISIPDVSKVFLSETDYFATIGTTPIKDFFSLGREPLIREELQNFELIEFGDNSLVNASYFYFLDPSAKNSVLNSIKINYLNELELISDRISNELGAFNAIHLRLGDFLDFYDHDGFSVNIEKFRRSINTIFSENDFPILIATDDLEKKELFQQLIGDRQIKFIDELIFSDFERSFLDLEFTDFNVLSVINQLICSNADQFIGTCRSTFTSIIHRLRQERYGKTEFDFFPDRRTERLMGSDLRMKPDQHGFFDWNRYSAFSEYYAYPCWMREWNYDLTSLM